ADGFVQALWEEREDAERAAAYVPMGGRRHEPPTASSMSRRAEVPLTDPQFAEEIELHTPPAHDSATRASCHEIDLYYKREAEVKLPEAVEGERGDLASLKRLLVRTNFAKTIINSTVTMAMA